MGYFLIKNCELADFETLTTNKMQILVRENRIEKIDAQIDTPAGFEVIDAKGMLAMPSFADCHSHLSQTFMKGPLDDYPITDWLVRLFRIKAVISPEENYYSCLLGALSALRCGTTVINEMADWPLLDSMLEALKDSRIRATVGISTTDIAENDATPVITIDEALKRSQAVCQKVRSIPGHRLRPSVAPAGLPACSREMMQNLKRFADERGLIFHTHLAEGRKETEDVRRKYGLDGAAEALYEFGLLRPHTLLAHSIWLSDHELDLIKETGAHPVHCPSTNLKISDGIPRIAEMLKRGIDVTLGCDGEASSSNRDMIREARLAAYLQKGRSLDPTVLDAGTMYRMMTAGGMQALGYEKMGEIQEGNIADFILVDMDHEIGFFNPDYKLGNFLYAADGRAVDTVFLDGEILLRGGRFTFIDEEEVLSRAEKAVHSLNKKIRKVLEES